MVPSSSVFGTKKSLIFKKLKMLCFHKSFQKNSAPLKGISQSLALSFCLFHFRISCFKTLKVVKLAHLRKSSRSNGQNTCRVRKTAVWDRMGMWRNYFVKCSIPLLYQHSHEWNLHFLTLLLLHWNKYLFP